MLTFVFIGKLLSFASLIPAMNLNLNSWWGMVTALGGCRGCGGCGGWVCVCVCVCMCVCVCVCACTCVHTQSCPTLCDPMDYSVPGSSVYGIFQARILEWVAISFCRRSSWPRNWTHVSCISCTDKWNLYHCDIWEAPVKALGMLNLSDTFKKVMNIELL